MPDVDLAAVGGLIGEPSRAAMLDALLAGRALTAGELARVAAVAPSTASEHLGRLLDGGLVEAVTQGRHRYFRLAGADVAAALEALALVAPPRRASSLRQSRRARSLAMARTCYDHLAGRAGVGLHDALLDRGLLAPATGGYAPTPAGEEWLAGLGVALGGAPARRRAASCLDWTERRPHLNGRLAVAVTARLVELQWFVPRPPDRRALRVTELGAAELARLGCVLDPLPT